jgi:hypothetical protein
MARCPSHGSCRSQVIETSWRCPAFCPPGGRAVRQADESRTLQLCPGMPDTQHAVSGTWMRRCRPTSSIPSRFAKVFDVLAILSNLLGVSYGLDRKLNA